MKGHRKSVPSVPWKFNCYIYVLLLSFGTIRQIRDMLCLFCTKSGIEHILCPFGLYDAKTNIIYDSKLSESLINELWKVTMIVSGIKYVGL